MMSAMFGNDTLIKDVDDIGFLDGAQSMGHGNGCPAFGSVIQGRLYDPFGFRIQRGSCFIEKENSGVAQKSASDGNTLLLTTRQ